jgi:hypothetical protein
VRRAGACAGAHAWGEAECQGARRAVVRVVGTATFLFIHHPACWLPFSCCLLLPQVQSVFCVCC